MSRKSILSTNNGDSLIYCRKCTEHKKADEFYSATDLFLDTNGKMSVCKSCIDDVYTHFYEVTRSVDEAILKTCRVLNVIYIPSSVEAVKTSIENKLDGGKDINNVFGLYKRMLSPHARGGTPNNAGAEDLTFTEPSAKVIEEIREFSIGSDEEVAELKEAWGVGLSTDDYEFLEKELADWKRTHKCDNKSEELLLKEICWKELAIKKAREDGKSTAALVKELQDIMKTAAVDPAKANAASGGKSADSFGVWIKDIEQLSPAEWWKDQSLFKDVDDIKKYAEEFITAPIRKFILGNSREYLTDSSADDTSEEDGENVQV